MHTYVLGVGIGENVTIRLYCDIWATIQYNCDFCDSASIAIRFCDILRFMFPILFKGITKNEENKTDQLTSNVTFNSVNNIIFYTLTEVQKLCPSGHLTFRIIVRDISHEC